MEKSRSPTTSASGQKKTSPQAAKAMRRFECGSPDTSPVLLTNALVHTPNCIFCGRAEKDTDDEVIYGEFLRSEDVSVHYNCLLSASILAQKGDEDEGIRGFAPGSIRNAARNGRKEMCVYCEQPGAVVGCCQKKCQRFFHFPCGQTSKCSTLFHGTFNSYCDEHAETLSHVKPQENIDACPICTEDFVESDQLFKSECCPTVSHMSCIRVFSYNAGTYVLKCPFCQDEDEFVPAVIKYSCIYIPTREPLFEDHDRMTVELDCCFPDCPEPERCENNDTWSLIKCTLCGSRAMHVCCTYKLPDRLFVCPDCGYDESWHEELRVKLSVRNQTGRAYIHQISSLTNKILAIALKDPTMEKITKSGRCSRRYQDKDQSQQVNVASVRLQSSKKEDANRSDSEDEDSDDEDDPEKAEKKRAAKKPAKRRRNNDENTSNAREVGNSKRQKKVADPPEANTASSSVLKDVTIVSSSNSNINMSNSVAPAGISANATVPVSVVTDENSATKKRKRGPKLTQPKKKKASVEPPVPVEKAPEPSGFFDELDSVECGTLVKPCEIMATYKNIGLDFFRNEAQPKKCPDCNPKKQMASASVKQFSLSGDSP